MTRIFLIDNDAARRALMAGELREHGFDVAEHDQVNVESLNGAEAIAALDWLVAHQVASVSNIAPLILLAEDPQVKASVTALQAGAKDYLPLPASTSDLMAAIERATAYSVRKPVRVAEPVEMIGSSEIMNTLRQRIAKVGPTDSTVLILGQSGTGKELVARGIHAASNRSHAPMITLNCATVPANLIEAELWLSRL